MEKSEVMKPVRLQVSALLKYISEGLFEKEHIMSLALLSTLAGESIFLLGPPGTAKSMIARRLKMIFRQGSSFEYLMSRFSTPDEIFGPVSISRLKESDTYERVVDGYLPTADVVFLDEIWKAGPAIQNTLLTVINEKLFRNGNTEIKLPLKLLVAASNELPVQGEGLDALWDRFLIRVISTCVKREETFYQMLLDEEVEENDGVGKWQITDEEYRLWQEEIVRVTVPMTILACITEIRQGLGKVEVQGSEVHRNVYVSDRRWKNIVRLLKASAFVHGRTEVTLPDLLPVYHCLWSEPDERTDIRQIVIRSLFASYVKEISSISRALKSDLKVSRVREALEKARKQGDRRDDDLLIVDHFYYQVENHGTGNTYIFIVDYRNLKEYNPKNAPATGMMYADPQNPKQTIIRVFSGTAKLGEQGAERVTLYRDDRNLYINGVRFPMRRLQRGEQQQLWLGNVTLTDRDYEQELETVNAAVEKLFRELQGNMFISEEDKIEVGKYVALVRKEIAWARVDVRKLRYGDES